MKLPSWTLTCRSRGCGYVEETTDPEYSRYHCGWPMRKRPSGVSEGVMDKIIFVCPRCEEEFLVSEGAVKNVDYEFWCPEDGNKLVRKDEYNE